MIKIFPIPVTNSFGTLNYLNIILCIYLFVNKEGKQKYISVWISNKKLRQANFDN